MSGSETLFWVPHEQLLQEVQSNRVHLKIVFPGLRPINLLVLDIFKDLFGRVIIERQVSCKELIAYNAKRPEVKHFAHILTLDHLRSHVVRCAEDSIVFLWLCLLLTF